MSEKFSKFVNIDLLLLLLLFSPPLNPHACRTMGKRDANGNELNVYFDKAYYLGGEIVTGKIVVQLRQAVKANYLAVVRSWQQKFFFFC